MAKSEMEVGLVEAYLADGGKLEDLFGSWNKFRDVLETGTIIGSTEGGDYNDLSLIGSIFCEINYLYSLKKIKLALGN